MNFFDMSFNISQGSYKFGDKFVIVEAEVKQYFRDYVDLFSNHLSISGSFLPHPTIWTSVVSYAVKLWTSKNEPQLQKPEESVVNRRECFFLANFDSFACKIDQYC